MANAKRTMLKFFKGFLEQDPVSCLLMLPDIPHVKICLMSIFNTFRSSSISKTSVLIHFRQTFFPTSVVARRLKSRHPFVPVAQQLISFSENNNIRAEQWVVLNSCCILNMKRLVTLKYKQRKTSKASQESDLEACQWFHGITMISTNIGTPKVISPNGLKTKRMKLEQSDN